MTMNDRSFYIGSSDAGRILNGDWRDLYLEKIGAKPPEDLSKNFQVQLGVYTEPFHREWLTMREGFEIVEQTALQKMPSHPMIAAHIDGWCRARSCFVEMKHSNGRANRDSILEWYLPQVAHICNVLREPSGFLSYIAGNAAPDWFLVEPSVEYRQALLEMELAFWWHVEAREVPNVIPKEKIEQARAAAKDVKIDGMRVVDMTGHNEWAALCIDYSLNKGAAKLFEQAKKDLKALVQADVRQASGHGVTIKRSKSGSLLFSEDD